MPRAISAVSQGLMPCPCSSAAQITVRPSIDPTDRSSSRMAIRKAIPQARIATKEFCSIVLVSWVNDRNE